MGRYLYLKVTKDEYELPVAVIESVDELAKIAGVKKKSVSTMISRKTGGYRRVAVTEDEE